MATVVGFAFLWLSVAPVGKQVFLLVVPAIPNAMLCMTTTAATVQKAAFGRKKSPPLAVKKQLIASPLSIPNRQEFILAVFKEIVVHTFPLKKVGNGLSLASLQVSRLTVGVILNLIISSYPFLFIFLLLVTPTANRNSYRVAILVWTATQGRGATRLNPGLGKRNSYRVARGAHHQLWNNGTWSSCVYRQQWNNHT